MIAGTRDAVAALLHAAGSWTGRVVQTLIVVAIVTSVTATILETVPRLHSYDRLFDRIELVCTVLFTAEVLLRIWSAGGRASPFARRRFPRLAYLLSPGGIVDLVAIVPFYLGASTFTLNGTNSIFLAAANLGANALLKYFAFAGSGNCTNLTLPQGATGYVSNSLANSTLYVVITSAGRPHSANSK